MFLTAGYGKGSVLLQIKVAGQAASVESAWESLDLDNRQGGVIRLDGYFYDVRSK